MRDFSIAEAGLVGFRLARERPTVIGAWTILLIVQQVATALVLIGGAGEAMNGLQAAMAGGGPAAEDPEAMIELFAQVFPVMLLLFPLWLAFGAVMVAAAARAVLWPEASRLGYLRFSAEEVRVLFALLAVFVFLFLAYLAGALALGIVGALLGAPQVTLFLMPALFLGLLWLWSRFSLAGPATLERGVVTVLGSWELTRGRARRVFLTLLMAVALHLLVMMLGMAIFLGVAAALAGSTEALETAMRPDYSSIGAYFRPFMIGNIVAMSFFSALGAAIILCPPAVIYRQIAADGAREAL